MSGSTRKNIIIAVVLMLTSAGVFGFMMYEVSSQGSELTAQIEALKVEQAQEATHLRLQRIAEESAADRNQINSYFLSRESDSIDFLNTVETIAPEAGVTLRTSGLETLIDPVDKTEWIEVNFAFSGERDAVQQFIQILETMPYVSKVTGIELGSRSSTNWYANVTMRVRILGYVE